MSAGVFNEVAYQADYGGGTNIHPIRIQPETALCTINSVANSASASAFTSPISARVQGTPRTKGLIARKVRLQFTAAVPTNYKAGGTITIPCLTKAFYDACDKNKTGTYLTFPVKVLGTIKEYAS